VRDLRVTPHALARYDELYAPEPPGDAPDDGGGADDGDDGEGTR
jgi:hypothetical protein